MRDKLFAVFKFDNLWWFLPFALLTLYGAQSLAGIFYFDSQAANEFLGIIALGTFVYLLTSLALRKYAHRPVFMNGSTRTYGSIDWWIAGISGLYFSLIIYALVTSEKIAIWEALNGGGAGDVAMAREAMFKARVGWEASLSYLNTLFSSAFMPYVLVLSYLGKRSYRHALLGLFVISLLPSLEKALVIKAFFPLILLALNGYLTRRSGYVFVALMFSIILGTTMVTKIGKLDFSAQHQPPKHSVERFEIVDTGNPAGFLVNRVFWIPYVTAYDWLAYFHEFLKDEHLHGRTSTLVSAITGQQRFHMENKVFEYEFGSEDVRTGTANAVFLVDGFVNFGWAGVILLAALVAMLVRLVELMRNPAASACLYYYIYQLSISGFLGVLFSSGFLLFIVFVLLVRPDLSGKSGDPV